MPACLINIEYITIRAEKVASPVTALQRERAGRRTLTRQIAPECVDCVGFRWPKSTFWANSDILGVPVPIAFYP